MKPDSSQTSFLNLFDADISFAMAVAEQGGIAIQRAMDYNKFRAAN